MQNKVQKGETGDIEKFVKLWNELRLKFNIR